MTCKEEMALKAEIIKKLRENLIDHLESSKTAMTVITNALDEIEYDENLEEEVTNYAFNRFDNYIKSLVNYFKMI